MRKGRFSEEQIIAILREQEAGMATAEVCRRHGSAAWRMPARCCQTGGTTTTEHDRTRASTGSRRTSLQGGPQRTITRTDSSYERVPSGGKVTLNKAHNRHIHIKDCIDLGLKIERLEDDKELQDLVLTVHHCFMHTLSNTNSIKIVENHDGAALIRQLQPNQP